jgi:anti-sigma regulatory factor (Ser/Thr protein kinase)
MCQNFEVQYLHCDTATPSAARAFAAHRLLGELPEGADSAIETAVLLVSELVTNAVRAGCRHLMLRLAVNRYTVRVAIEDDAGGVPRPRVASVEDVGGRGLTIVSALSRGWGMEPTAAGKSVWADIELPGELQHTSPCTEL